MNLKKKVRAFTLIEVTISMLIAAIVIVTTYTAYQIISQNYLNYVKKQNLIASFTIMDKLLRDDFLKANPIVKTDSGLEFHMDNGKVQYQFNDSLIIRNQYNLRLDTFNIVLHTINFTFENEESGVGRRIDLLSYLVTLDNETIPMSYRKMYSAQNLFN